MPVTVQGTQITFNNGTVQTTAFTNPFQLQNQLFTSSGSWTAPAGVTRVKATVIAGGGGGSAWAGSSGGGGGYSCAWVTVSPGTTYTVTVGGGGFYQGGNGFGGTGGTSSFGSFLSATGGGGGSNNAPLFGSNGSGTVSSGTAIAVGNVHGNSQFRDDTAANYSPRSAFLGYGQFMGAWNRGFTSSAPAYSGTAQWAAGSTSVDTSSGGVGGVVFLEWVAP